MSITFSENTYSVQPHFLLDSIQKCFIFGGDSDSFLFQFKNFLTISNDCLLIQSESIPLNLYYRDLYKLSTLIGKGENLTLDEVLIIGMKPPSFYDYGEKQITCSKLHSYKSLLSSVTDLSDVSYTQTNIQSEIYSNDLILSSTTLRLFEQLKPINNFTVLFDSNQLGHSYDSFWERLSDQTEVVIFIELPNERIFGMYFNSIPTFSYDSDFEISYSIGHFLFTLHLHDEAALRYDRIDFYHSIVSSFVQKKRNVFFRLNHIFKITTENTILLNRKTMVQLKYAHLKQYSQLFGKENIITDEIPFQRMVVLKISDRKGTAVSSLKPYQLQISSYKHHGEKKMKRTIEINGIE